MHAYWLAVFNLTTSVLDSFHGFQPGYSVGPVQLPCCTSNHGRGTSVQLEFTDGHSIPVRMPAVGLWRIVRLVCWRCNWRSSVKLYLPVRDTFHTTGMIPTLVGSHRMTSWWLRRWSSPTVQLELFETLWWHRRTGFDEESHRVAMQFVSKYEGSIRLLFWF